MSPYSLPFPTLDVLSTEPGFSVSVSLQLREPTSVCRSLCVPVPVCVQFLHVGFHLASFLSASSCIACDDKSTYSLPEAPQVLFSHDPPAFLALEHVPPTELTFCACVFVW